MSLPLFSKSGLGPPNIHKKEPITETKTENQKPIKTAKERSLLIFKKISSKLQGSFWQ
jgi:hypothetical protein